MQSMADIECGEAGTVLASAQVGGLTVISSLSNLSIEAIRAAAPSARLFFQLYVYKDLALTESLIRRAESCGCLALVITVDHPYCGLRERDARNGFRMPTWLTKGNFPPSAAMSEKSSTISTSADTSASSSSSSSHAELADASHDQSFNWARLSELSRLTRLPILLKGILTREDATLACQHGVAGIIVSNHGGRQLDSVAATAEALPECVAAVREYNASERGAVEVFVDGGIRRGSDIFKALALGARAVFIGRPVVWGLAYAGQTGVRQVLQLLLEELKLVMALAGTPTIADITTDRLATSRVSIPVSLNETSSSSIIGSFDCHSMSSSARLPCFPPPSGSHPPSPFWSRLLNVADYEAYARYSLTPAVYEYYRNGARDEQTLRENRLALARLRIRPRVLIDVSQVSTNCRLLSSQPPPFSLSLASPILIAPSAMQAMAHPDGELATARAASSCGTVMTLSTVSNYSIEQVRSACGPDTPLWFQLYVYNSRDLTASLIRRAAEAGYTGLVLTVDTPLVGGRDAEIKHKFSMPTRLKLGNFLGELPGVHVPDQRGSLTVGSPDSQLNPLIRSASETWESLDWIKSVSSLPLLVKGVLTAEAAIQACQHGADAIIVSNHGGRQLDGVAASVECLEAVITAVNAYNHTNAAVNRRVWVLVDGGIRRGSDVFKCLALGASAVLIGRPVLWGLAAAGQAGVERILSLLQAELKLTMALAGCRHLAEIRGSHLSDGDQLMPTAKL